jgi:hypothetical protein
LLFKIPVEAPLGTAALAKVPSDKQTSTYKFNEIKETKFCTIAVHLKQIPLIYTPGLPQKIAHFKYSYCFSIDESFYPRTQ